MKAPIKKLFYENSYCSDWCARKDNFKSSTYKLEATMNNNKNTKTCKYYSQKEE